MKKIAFLTDAHLGQKLALTSTGTDSEKIIYRDEVNEYKENLKTVLTDIVQKGIYDVVFGGDIGSRESNKWFFDTINEYELKLRVILGNHDSYDEVSKHYTSCIITEEREVKYVQEDEYFKYIFLDTSSNSVSATQFKWFKENLKTQKKIIIFLHHPILKIDTPIDYLGAALNGRNELKQTLLEIKNEVTIFCGHYHMEDWATEENILQFSTIACSYQIEKNVKSIRIDNQLFGYRIISIEDDHIDTELVSFHR